nr:MAG TPA: hypothetical protein [Caudoviricetes sp.]
MWGSLCHRKRIRTGYDFGSRQQSLRCIRETGDADL